MPEAATYLTIRYEPAGAAAYDPVQRDVRIPTRGSLKQEPFGIRIPDTEMCAIEDTVRFWKDANRVVGFALAPLASESMESVTLQVYLRILEACQGYSLYRMWNWVPQINEIPEGLDEHYRLFCAGRARAFESVFGQSPESRMPAASGVGVRGDQLIVLFVAGTQPVEHLENPRQLPAYHYPPVYGPCPPSFARASRVSSCSGQWTFVSGTAAIVESESQCIANLHGQIQVTLDNLAMMGVASGSTDSTPRFFRIYLRNWEDLTVVQRQLNTALLRPADTAVFVEADICRSDLLVEIEACFFRE